MYNVYDTGTSILYILVCHGSSIDDCHGAHIVFG